MSGLGRRRLLWLTAPKWQVDKVMWIARQLAEGLEAAHERGIVDRDVKILDFGLAKMSDWQLARAWLFRRLTRGKAARKFSDRGSL